MKTPGRIANDLIHDGRLWRWYQPDVMQYPRKWKASSLIGDEIVRGTTKIASLRRSL